LVPIPAKGLLSATAVLRFPSTEGWPMPDICLGCMVVFMLFPLVVGGYALLREWRESRYRQQYCPECGLPAPAIGRATHCSRCGCEYDQFGNPAAGSPARPDWQRLDLDKFGQNPLARDDLRYREKDGYQEGLPPG
jgi:hypothetical protein